MTWFNKEHYSDPTAGVAISNVMREEQEMIYKACSRCGKFHPHGYVCTKGKKFNGGAERKLRHLNAWAIKSAEIRERANNLCEYCRSKGRYNYQDLEVHHIEKLREHPELLLEDSNLVCLCHTCHKMADNGEISKEELKKLAELRDRNDSPLPS